MFYVQNELVSKKITYLKIINDQNCILGKLPNELPDKITLNLGGLKGKGNRRKKIKQSRVPNLRTYFPDKLAIFLQFI